MKMITLEIKDLQPGYIAARDIISKKGQIIASSGTELSPQLIARLSFYKIETVTIEDPVSEEDLLDGKDLLDALNELVPDEVEEVKEEPKAKEPIKEKPTAPPVREKEVINDTISYSNRLKAAPEYQEFQIDYSKALVALENTFIDIIEHNGEHYNRSSLLKAIEPMYLSKTSLDILTYIHNMQGNDDSVYAHSINVALVCRAIGKWLKMNRDDLDDLTLAGLLHDIGKLNVPTEVLGKTGKLTDEEFALIKKHPLDGRKMLKQCPAIDSRFLNAALQHHERSDGSGYPRGLTDDEIDDFAAIVAIADVYDAMTATRSYRSALSPFEVIQAFENDGLSKYRTQYILTFLERMAFAYQNSLVMLSDGRRGRVVYLNKNKLSRPILELADKSMLDLSRESGINIISIL
ncbi:MAG: HD-GYP domain-containing protein [Lachnospiraceae bacterium]|nr:HD-GYP domain-containing protein [Lachnospiraceae bacterium]